MSDKNVPSQFPILHSERVLLREIRDVDAEAIFAFKSDVEVTRHYGQEPHRTLADTHDWLRRLDESYRRGEDFAWLVTLNTDGSVAGLITLWNFDASRRCAELGYELAREYQHQGIMSEATAKVIEFGFATLGLHRIEANPLTENAASVALLRILGFKLEGILHERIYFRGAFYDQAYYALLSEG